jgi:hypothetical protein
MPAMIKVALNLKLFAHLTICMVYRDGLASSIGTLKGKPSDQNHKKIN